MFKRKVKISSERVLEKMEIFLENQNVFSRLTPKELYAFRYSFDGLKTNISNSELIKRIFLRNILSTLEDCDFIIFSDEGFSEKIGDKVSTVCSKLDKRMIFLYCSPNNSSIIENIFVYEPSFSDSLLYISGDDGNYYVEEMASKELISCYIQDDNIVEVSELSWEKEFFGFTTLNINKSKIIVHYVP